MFCIQCGKEIADHSKFCSECGKSTSTDTESKPKETADNKKQYQTRVIVNDSNSGFLGALSGFISRTVAVGVGIFLFFFLALAWCNAAIENMFEG